MVIAKGKINTFAVARKHEVNGMILAYTSIKQMEHLFSLLFCEKINGRKCAAGFDVTNIPHII